MMPAFDASRFEARPEAESGPADEFGAGSASKNGKKRKSKQRR